MLINENDCNVVGGVFEGASEHSQSLGFMVVDEFDDGPFSTEDLLLNIPCSAVGGERGVFVNDSGGNTTPTVASLVEGNGYMELAVGNSPGTYEIGYARTSGGRRSTWT